ncbi:programmed cell death protein 7 [Terrapene carolina triunguis]|uniref:programmed cell death protein 7 n=1 Tax=Terrapene triunguis TaxID=2587831 RepID=UPI000E775F86|nr:programmed cell death protein 7 [Terrapene carolina triunguis]
MSQPPLPFAARFAGPPPPPQYRCFPPPGGLFAPPPAGGPFPGAQPPPPPPFLPPPAGGPELPPGRHLPAGGPYFPAPAGGCGPAPLGREAAPRLLFPAPGPPAWQPGPPPPQARQLAAGALRPVAQLAGLCRALRQQEAAGGEAGWGQARALLSELRDQLRPLREPGSLGELRRKAEKARKRRLRLRKRKQEAEAAREEEAARAAEREARIDRWRAKCVQEVEEKNRERELKAAADSVLSEVRKKQADTKRMVDILRALEKLRKLRKEAAGRKGVCPPPSADEDFEHHIERLRALIRKRTELYEAEERALRVMLEGEQEEERKREMEKKQKKEREKLLQQKRDIDSKLFGDPDEFPLNHLLQPFRQYYLQAEHSVPALIQIRHEWDQYLVPADHPEGSCIPPGWVLPTLPTSDTWATAVR